MSTAAPHVSPVSSLSEGKRVLRAEASAILAVEARLGDEFDEAVRALHLAPIVHVTGVGKSGHVARKIAGTMASTGTAAHFLHPTEAVHGDMGNIRRDHALILISRSGECEETLRVMEAIRAVHRPTVGGAYETATAPRFIALTGVTTSRLATGADTVLDCAADEACPHGLAPTSSTAAAMAMGDALAMALMRLRGFTAEDFKASHPGGVLGRYGEDG